MKAITQWVSRPVRIAMVLPVLLFSGCVSHVALKSDFGDYSESYGQANNRQLLLNIARLSQDDPVAFIQLASISSQYQFSTSAGFNPTGTRTAPVANGAAPFVQHALTFGGTAGTGLTQTPIFQFVPITGTNLIEALLTPITDKVFLTFFDQGYPADLVVRTMVESVQHEVSTNFTVNNLTIHAASAHTNNTRFGTAITTVAAYTNLETVDLGTNYVEWAMCTNTYITETGTNTFISRVKPAALPRFETLVNSPDDLSYPRFLLFCRNVRNAQLVHALTVDTVSNATELYYSSITNTKLTDVVSAVQAGLSVKYAADSGEITVNNSKPGLVLKAETNSILAWADLASQSNALTFDIQEPSWKGTNAVKYATRYANGNYKLKLRTFEAALYGVAKEEARFRELAREPLQPGIIYGKDAFGPYVILNNLTNRNTKLDSLTNRVAILNNLTTSFAVLNNLTNINATLTDTTNVDAMLANPTNGVPDRHAKANKNAGNYNIRVRPIMTLTHPGGERVPLTTVADVRYNGREYSVGDEDNSNQNRMVFTMLSYLFAQTAISTQNLPVQQLIQVQ